MRRFCVTFIQKKERDLKFFTANTLNSYAKDTTTDFAYVLLKNILRSAAKRILKVHTSHSIHKTEEEPVIKYISIECLMRLFASFFLVFKIGVVDVYFFRSFAECAESSARRTCFLKTC